MSRRRDPMPEGVPPGYFRFSRWQPEGELFLTWRIHFRRLGLKTLLVHAVIEGRKMVSLWREGEEAVCYEVQRRRKIKVGPQIHSVRANVAGDPQP